MSTQASTRNSTLNARTYLEHKLDKARARIKSADIASGLVFIAVGWICFLLLSVMIDQLIELPDLARLVALFIGIAASALVLIRTAVLPLMSKVNTRFAARSVEQADPQMKNSVLSYVELAEHRERLSDPILRNIEMKAATDIGRVKIEDAIQPRHIMPALYLLAAVVVLFCFYSFFTTKSFGASIRRVLWPLTATAPPTATHLDLYFEPADKDRPNEPGPIPFDGSLKCTASVTRGKPDRVTAYLQSEGSEYEEPIELDRTGEFEFILNLAKRQKSFDIRLVADDYRSRRYHVPVIPSPMITEWRLRYEPPAYTGEAPFEGRGGDIRGLEGTVVHIEAVTNVAVDPHSARMELRLDGVESTQQLTVDGEKIAGSLTLKADGSYSVTFRDQEGRAPEFRPNNHIRVLKDLPPAVEFSSPAEVEHRHPLNAPLAIKGLVRDDYGVQKAALKVTSPNDAGLIVREFGDVGQSLGRELVIEEEFDLSKLAVQAGDVLEYWVEAEDNKLPVSNVTSNQSEKRKIILTPPEEPQNKPEQQNQPKQQREPSPEEKKDGEQQNANEPSKGEGQPQEGNEANQGEQSKDGKGAEDGEGTPSKEGTGSQPGQPGEGGEQGESSGEGSDPAQGADEKDLEKLKEFFDEKGGRDGQGQKQGDKANQSPDGKQGEPASDKQNPGEEGKEKSEPADRKRDGEAGDPKSNPSGEKQQGKPKEGSEAASEGGETQTDTPDSKPAQNASGKTSEGDQPSGQGAQSGNKQEQQASQESGEGGEKTESQGKNGEAKSPSAGEKRTSEKKEGEGKNEKQDSSGKPSGQSNPGAGESSEDQGKEKSDKSQPGEASQENKGDAQKSAEDDTPRPGNQNQEGNSEGSHKEGQEDSSAASEANQEGKANQGESATSGQSSTGSPSPEKGDNSNSTGEQEGKGQTEGEGDEHQGDKSPGEGAGDKQQSPSSSKEGEEKDAGDGKGSETQDQQSGGESDGEASSEASDQKPSDDGSSGESSDSPPQGKGKQGEPSEGKPSGAPPQEDGELDPKNANENASGQGGTRGSGEPQKNEPFDNTGDKANPEDAAKGSNLILKRLEEQLKNKKVDPELLKRMGWTEEDAKKFAERMRERASADKTNPMTGRDRQSFGQGTDLKKSTRTGAGKVNDLNQDLFSGRRTPVPPQIRKRFEAYTKSLSDLEAGADRTSPPAKSKESSGPPQK